MDFFLNKIDKHLDNHRSVAENMNDLKRKLKELNGLMEDTESRMRSELQPRKKLKKEVQIWLENVKRINGEIRSLDERLGGSNALSRGFYAENVSKKINEVEELIQRGKFHEGLVIENPQWTGQVLSTTSLSGEYTKFCMEEIWQHLMDDEVHKIGVCGMGGVGKTSMMKLINNQLLKETEKFGIVIWITVSKEMSTAKLQKDIASKVNVTFSGNDDEITRAGKLFETLVQKRRFVIILDDLWENISLEKVGIPEPSNGSKLLLTTRSFDVCRYMGCRVIKVKTLVEDEAWELFLEKAGRDLLNFPQLKPIAKSIAKHCAGLPLAIITIAASMKGIYDLYEWRNAHKELSLHMKSVNGLEDEVFQQLRFSYDRLKDPKLQNCFLSCVLYPEDHEIRKEDLIRLWIAEGLVEELDSRQAEFDRGRAIMNKLINNCILEDVIECVKMHDLIRDMALRITSGRPRFLVKTGMGLTEPPHVHQWSTDLEKVSFMDARFGDLHLSEVSPPKCPMLTTLLLSNCYVRSIPEGFFGHMHGLKILDLSRNYMKCIPNSIGNLKNLTSLLLAECVRLENVPSLSKLVALKELNLERTSIKEIPEGMEYLSSLKYLNLSDNGRLNKIPNGILSKLSRLQHLIVGEMLISGEEAGGLKKLEIFEGVFYDLHEFNMYIQALRDRKELPEYIIHVGERGSSDATYTRKCIALRGCNIYSIDQPMFPHDIEELSIWNCNLHCHEEHSLSSRFFLLRLDPFSSLKCLEINNFKNMKKLFSPNYVPLNLEELHVWDCDHVEEIIASEVGRAMEFRLPKLRRLELKNLPKLKSICCVGGLMVCDSLEYIFVANCLKLNRLPLYLPLLDDGRLSPPPSLVLIDIYPMEWWESVELDHPNAKSVLEQFSWFR